MRRRWIKRAVENTLQHDDVSHAVRAAHPALQLQAKVGNRTASQLLAGSGALQCMLHVGPVDDPCEREADQVAAEVVCRIGGAVEATGDDVGERGDGPNVRRRPVAGFSDVAGSGPDGGPAAPEVEASIAGARGGGRGLEPPVLRQMEGAFGADFGDVRVHADGQSDRLSRQLNARAFTFGSDIFFSRGEYDPGSTAGRSVLAHELTHVLQQGAASIRRLGGGPWRPRNGGNRTGLFPVQRLALWMEDDQKEAVELLARKGKTLFGFSLEEPSGYYGGVGLFHRYKDHTLTLWGHCGQRAFGQEGGPEGLVNDLLTRKFGDSEFQVLELIGCGPNVTYNKTVMSYAQGVKALLDERMTRKVTVKSFPMPAAGKVSTNYRFEPANKFLYFSCTPEQMKTLKSQIAISIQVYWLDRNDPKQALKAYKACLGKISDLNAHADREEKVEVTTGDITDIRSHLEATRTVTTHKKSVYGEGEESELFFQDVVGEK